MLLQKITCETQGGLDVSGLATLVATGQQDDQLSPPLLEIHPVTGTVVDPQLRDTFANRLDVPGVSGSEPFNPCLDARSRLKVTQGVEPLSEEVSFANFYQEGTVAMRLHIVNITESNARLTHLIWHIRSKSWRWRDGDAPSIGPEAGLQIAAVTNALAVVKDSLITEFPASLAAA